MVVEFIMPLVDYDNEEAAHRFIEMILPSDSLASLRVFPTDDYICGVAGYEFQEEWVAAICSAHVVHKLEDAEMPFECRTRLSFDPLDFISLG